MGVRHLNTLLKTNAPNGITKLHINKLSNRVVAIDTSIYLYRYKTCNGAMPNNKDNGLSGLIENMYLMISIFKKYNITPIFVFDGTPPAEKNALLETRKQKKAAAEAKWHDLHRELESGELDDDKRFDIISAMNKERSKFVRIHKEDINEVKKLMEVYGVSYVDAEGEADILCARLVESGEAYGCLSEDMDMFVYGTTRVFRYLSLVNLTVVEYNLPYILKQLDVTFNEFKEVCVLSGTDYNNNNNNNNNICRILKLLYKYKKSMKNLTIQPGDFINWLINNSYCSNLNITEYNTALDMFNLDNCKQEYNINSPKTDAYNKDNLRQFMTRYGFIYPKGLCKRS